MKNTILLTLSLFVLVAKTSIAAPQSKDYEIQKLGSRTYLVKTGSGKTESIGSHSGAILLPSGLFIIDTHASTEVESRVQKDLFDLTKQSAFAAINTHHHDDHSGGNGYYEKKKIPVWAHGDAVKEIKNVGRTAESLKPAFVKKMLSDEVEIISIGAAHSVGDVVVYDKKDKVLYMGDLFVNGYIGYLGEAHFKNWIESLDKLTAMDVQTVVAGHGPPATLKELQAFKTYLIDFVRSAKVHFEKTGKVDGYELPEKYKSLGAQFYLPDNIARAFELWKQGLLSSI